MPLRILLLDSWSRDPSLGSGSATAIAGLVGALEARGHTVVRPRRCVSPSGARRLPSLAGRVAFNASLPLRVRPSRFDLVIGIDIDGSFLRPRPPAPYVVCLKGVAADEARFERGMTRRRLLTIAALERRNARRAERVIVPSRYSLDVAVERYGLRRSRMRVVPEGIDVAYWGAAEASPETAAAGPAPQRGSGPLTILTVARHYPRKNTVALVRALPVVARAVPEVRLRIVGGGPELPRLRRLVTSLGLQDRVDLLGRMEGSERVRREYARADLFCLPSLQEGFGIAFLEAMAAGLPIVGLRAGAVPELVPDGVAGVLVDPERAPELAEALSLLLRDPERRARMGHAGREIVRTYGWQAVADRFLEAALGP